MKKTFSTKLIMKLRLNPGLLIFLIPVVFCAYSGPRYLYSASPLISPIPLERGATSLDINYFSHAKKSDSTGNHDNAFVFGASHMIGKKTLIVVSADVKKEQDIFTGRHDSLLRLKYNGGFDSSNVTTKRFRTRLGIVYFFHPPDSDRWVIPSVAGSVDLHRMNLNESGEFNNNRYGRFFDMYQVSLSFQYNLLFRISKQINLTYITRMTQVKFFTPKTDYTREEGFNTGLRQDIKMELCPCFISGYADYKPFKAIPLYLCGQFFNDLVYWKHPAAAFDPGRTYVKGSGISIGAKYVFR